ncbi:MAG TPA: BamA/TamA family outer membrane protein [Candidatus Acidoferrales bacterium]|nr:BamA/TamA family outer membrane protein [Candidatus Acidoferrales bacterium]
MFLAVMFAALAARAADKASAPPPKLKIRGYGWFGDLRLNRTIKLMEFPSGKPAFFDAGFVEDCFVILSAKLHDDGFLQPKITVDLTLTNGQRLSYMWTETAENALPSLPQPLEAREVKFYLKPGVLYHYSQIQFLGLEAMSAKQARSFFIETSGLIPLEQNRIYSPERLNRSVSNLQQALEQVGYHDARVNVAQLNRSDKTGAVAVTLQIKQGQLFMVRSVVREVYQGAGRAPVEIRTNELQDIYSEFWEQDYIQSIKTNYYRQGYPQVSVDVRIQKREAVEDKVFLNLLATVHPGPRIRTGDIEFVGNKQTRWSLLQARVPLKPGDWLDRQKAEEGQYRVSRLGVFKSVELNYEPVNSNLWNVTYDVQESKRIDVNLLFGVGSYDLLRGGVELDQYNLWGLAHSQSLELVQSFKSSSGNYTYTIPELFGLDMDAFFDASGLRRQEPSFIRQEYGGGAGLKKEFPNLHTDASLRYNYGILQATSASINFAPLGAQSPEVGELILDVNHSRLDNPLYPHNGYQLLGNVEYATPYFGGQADFLRMNVGASYHLPLNNSEWLHFRLQHGVAVPLGNDQSLPFVRRFFPGGADSIRGYSEGEASPRNDQGQFVGAETYASGTVEFEQALTPKWSVVAFVDALEEAQNLNHYPGDQALFSAGSGLSWRTIIGPIRLEYGYNLNPRPGDPMGTIQFSLGVPF